MTRELEMAREFEMFALETEFRNLTAERELAVADFASAETIGAFDAAIAAASARYQWISKDPPKFGLEPTGEVRNGLPVFRPVRDADASGGVRS